MASLRAACGSTRIQVLHLYRHILREISYLPPALATSVAAIVKSRFHGHANSDKHVKKRISRAKATLNTIWAANKGKSGIMEGLINKAFGRAGVRRRELISRFVRPEGPNDSSALESLVEAINTSDKSKSTAENTLDTVDNATAKPKSPNHAFLDKWDRPKLLRLLKSQKSQERETNNGAVWPGSKIRTVDENVLVPKTNTWGKPLGPSRVRSIQAKWWKNNISKVMVPLGKGEWDLLGHLGEGMQEVDGWRIPARRLPATTTTQDGDASDDTSWNWEKYATHPTATVERPSSVVKQQRGQAVGLSPYIGRNRRNSLSDRWYRRAYSRTWSLTPHMEQNPNTLQYNFKWGKNKTMTVPPTARQLELFEGVDESGKIQRT